MPFLMISGPIVWSTQCQRLLYIGHLKYSFKKALFRRLVPKGLAYISLLKRLVFSIHLFSPNRDYNNQNFTVSWNHKTGSHIEKGDVIYQLKGKTQTPSTTADKECQIILKECKNGRDVKRSGVLLGKIDDSKPVTNSGIDELPTHDSSALARTKITFRSRSAGS